MAHPTTIAHSPRPARHAARPTPAAPLGLTLLQRLVSGAAAAVLTVAVLGGLDGIAAHEADAAQAAVQWAAAAASQPSV